MEQHSQNPSGRSGPWRMPSARKVVAVVAVLAVCQNAMAGSVLHRPGAVRSADPAAAIANQQAAAAAARAALAQRQADSPLHHAFDAIRRFQAAQDAARAAAGQQPSSVPDGLGVGALDLATGDIHEHATLQGETVADGRHEVTVTQDDGRAIMTWNSFNVGRNTDLYFDQSAGGSSAGSWVILNRVLDSGKPSQILGSIKAEGQVYVLNRNGILFSGTSQVNVAGGLLASALDIKGESDAARLDRFRNEALYDLSFELVPPGGATSELAGKVWVEAGARLSVGSTGRIVLLGREVRNGGALEAPDGQVYLAAGSTVALGNAADNRGLKPPALNSYSPITDSTSLVVNTGLVSAPRGNITLVGGTTRQDGLLTATNGAEEAGSIVLGGDGLTTVFGAGSATQILPDQDGKKVIGTGTSYTPASILALGNDIRVEGGATLYAPSGAITLSAVMTAPKPDGENLPSTTLDTTRVTVESGARIDVSGLEDVEVAMEQNTIKAELRANELRDNPLVRSGPLRGRTVYFDARLGTKLSDGSGVADLSGYYDLLERDVSQLMTSGGTVTLDANQVVTRSGSVVDLSGGSLRFLDGHTRSTVLIDQSGRRVPIEQADAGVTYVGIDGDHVVSHARWGITETYSSGLSQARPRFERGYVQGGSAGTLAIGTNDTRWYAQESYPPPSSGAMPQNPSATGAVRDLQNDLVARTIVGSKQRDLPTGSTDPTVVWSQRPAGATLVLDRAGNVVIDRAADGNAAPGDQLLPSGWFDGKTVSAVSITSGYDPDTNSQASFWGLENRAVGGHLRVGAGTVVDLGDGGSLTFSGKSAEIRGTLLAPGGNVSLTALDKLRTDEGDAPDAVHLGTTGLVDVAGRLTNDALDGLSGPMRALKGGSVKLAGAQVLLDAGSLLDVSGGARIDASGKVKGGDAGSITLDVSQQPQPFFGGNPQPPVEPLANGRLVLAGTLAGHALGRGGSLAILTGKDVVLGGAFDPDAGRFDAGFFTRGGFAAYSIQGRTVTVSGDIAPRVTEGMLLPEMIGELHTGTRLLDVAPLGEVLDAAGYGQAMTLSLTADGKKTFGSGLDVAAGSTLQMSPGSTVRLSVAGDKAGMLTVEGEIQARGGSIELNAPSTAPSTGVALGDRAILDARGYADAALVAGEVVRSVVAGGQIKISSSGALTLAPGDTGAPGATLDVSGVKEVVDMTSIGGPPGSDRYVARTVDGDAGSIVLTGRDGSIAGRLRLAPGGDSGHGGALSIAGAGHIIVSQSSLPAAGSKGLHLTADAVDASGADDLTLTAAQDIYSAASAILFDGSVDLRTRRSINLNSFIVGSVPGTSSSPTLTSGFVSLLGAMSNQAVTPDAPSTEGILTVKADVIDVARTVLLGCGPNSAGVTLACGGDLDGFAKVRLLATGDIRLSNHDPAGTETVDFDLHPGLFSPGDLELQAAQVYVASRGHADASTEPLERSAADPGFLVQSGTRITIGRSGGGDGTPPIPLSFGERLTLRAPDVEQGGVLRAPAGQIRLEGQTLEGDPTGKVVLLDGSVTSVSLDRATVAFGSVQTGGVFPGYNQAGQAPTLSVKLDGSSVEVRKGAVIDVSGGGDLLGYSFVPGNSGSADVLDYNGGLAAPGLGGGRGLPAPFAVLPSMGAGPAPIGPVSGLRDGRLRVGDQVYLQGVPGLAPGYYTLLPAHYALLPGGFLVQQLSGSYASAPATYARSDGASIASGYRAVSGTSIRDPGYSRFVVVPSSGIGDRSQLDTYSFDESARRLAADAGVSVRTPFDAGNVAIAARDGLVLDGTGLFAPGTDEATGKAGLLGSLDVSASKIAVVGGTAQAPDGYLVIRTDALEGFGAGSVLLGGARAASGAGTAVTVGATDVLVDTGGTTWSGPEILLAATGSVSISGSSHLAAAGSASADAGALTLQGQGALLRVSTGSRVGLVRNAATGGTATLSLAAGASLSAPGSITLEASNTVQLDPAVALSAPQLDLASSEVHLGDAGGPTTGTALDRAQIEQLAASSDLLIRGYDSIHLHGDLALGGGSAAKLTLDSRLVQGHATSDETVRISAGALTLRNTNVISSASPSQPQAGAGSLVLDVDALVLGPGKVQLAGYDALKDSRAGTVEVRGPPEASTGAGTAAAESGLDFQGSSFSLATAQVRAISGAGYRLSGLGSLELRSLAGAAAPAAADSLGGRLTLQAASIALDTSIALPAGTFEAIATSGPLSVGSNARIDVSGRAVDFYGQSRFAPGGAIRLVAAGDLSISGATLDVSGAATGGDAGRIEVVAGGVATQQGILRGVAAAGGAGGSFTLDAGSVPSFSALNQALEVGGFTAAREIRLRRQQDGITLAAGDQITAHEVLLRSDAGAVTVLGRIDASGGAAHPGGGHIQLIGGGGVDLEGTLDAHTYDGELAEDAFAPAAGKIELIASGGRAHIGSGAGIDVSGRADGRGGPGGAVVLRADRLGGDVAIDPIEGQIRGAGQVLVQGVQTYQAATGIVDANLGALILADAGSWLSGGQAIQSRLAGANAGLAAAMQIGAGALVTSDAGLVVQDPVALNGALGAGYLGLVARNGDLAVNAAVSDGFAGATPQAALLATPSASLELEASGNVTVAPQAMIRTGTGDVSIHAGGDVTLQASPNGRAVVYTAGRKAPWASGFLGAPGGMPLGELPVGGGDIDIRAAGDVTAPATTQTTSAWLFRYGDSSWTTSSSSVRQQTSWSIVFENFEQGLGALGGGNVSVRAGGDIDQLQVAIPTTGQLTTPAGSVSQAGDLVVRGGGDLRMVAGHDILGGLLMLGRGHADVHAGGAVAPAGSVRLRTDWSSGPGNQTSAVGLLLGLMDATASVTAGSGVYLEGAFDPMLQGQVAENLQPGATGAAWWGNTDRTALAATALGGSVNYETDPWASVDLSYAQKVPVSMSGTVNQDFRRAPPALKLTSLAGSVFLEDHFRGTGDKLELTSAPRGTLELLAGQDVHLRRDVVMLDVDPRYGRGPLAPYSTTANGSTGVAALGPEDDQQTNHLRGSEPVHLGDPDPVRIYALDGSVCAQASGRCRPESGTLPASYWVGVTLPKPLEVMAGQDIVRGFYQPQNNAPGDTSIFLAGRDVYQPFIWMRGQGSALLQAGRDVVLSQSAWQSLPTLGGNLYGLGNGVLADTFTSEPIGQVGSLTVNTALPADKATDFYVLAGTANGTDYVAFRDAYLDPANGKGVVRTYLPELRQYMKKLDPSGGTASDADLLAAFEQLSWARQEVFLDQVYFTELKETGIDYNDRSGPRYRSYQRGFDAVKLLFPKDPSTIPEAERGNVILAAKPFETWSSAAITVLAPYGTVEVGSKTLASKYNESAYGGLVTRRGGDIRIMADQNIDLYTSRVFTLQGGDITMWTTNGSITAGSGSKTSVLQIPLRYRMTPEGAIQIDQFGLSTGAGIGVLDALQGSDPNRTRSRLDLIAPNGEVNAGDAGIRVVGDINIAALAVVGMDNIQVSGASAGVPTVPVPDIGALTTAGALAQSAAKEGVGPAASTAATPPDLPSIITVEVVGYETTGDDQGENGKPRKKSKPDSK